MSLTQVDLSRVLFRKEMPLFSCQQEPWLWNGKSANPDEKAKANSMAENMCTLERQNIG
jgi:hypothetical protein